MVSYKDKHQRFNQLEKTITDKYKISTESVGPFIIAELIKKIAVDDILKDCEFVVQYYEKDSSNCLNDKFFIVKGDQITSSLESFVGNNFKFTFYLAEQN